jgi:hypothetical protein
VAVVVVQVAQFQAQLPVEVAVAGHLDKVEQDPHQLEQEEPLYLWQIQP